MTVVDLQILSEQQQIGMHPLNELLTFRLGCGTSHQPGAMKGARQIPDSASRSRITTTIRRPFSRSLQAWIAWEICATQAVVP